MTTGERFLFRLLTQNPEQRKITDMTMLSTAKECQSRQRWRRNELIVLIRHFLGSVAEP
jgi:hypothetical protein